MATVAAMLGAWLLQPDDQHTMTVIHVTDGDTITVRAHSHGATPEVVRILGVDTPETHHPRKGIQCFGPEAAEATRAALLGKEVTIVRGLQPTDVYGRTLARVSLDGRSFAEWLVSQGYARVLVFSPNDSDARSLVGLEQHARESLRGLWGACPGAGHDGQ